MKSRLKKVAVCFVLLCSLTLAAGGCCSHGSWGDKNGWQCHS